VVQLLLCKFVDFYVVEVVANLLGGGIGTVVYCLRNEGLVKSGGLFLRDSLVFNAENNID